MIDCSFGSCLLPYLLIKIARHFCLAHRLIRSLYCSVFKESSLFKRLDYLTTNRFLLSSTFLKFFSEGTARGRRPRGDRYDDTMDCFLCQQGILKNEELGIRNEEWWCGASIHIAPLFIYWEVPADRMYRA